MMLLNIILAYFLFFLFLRAILGFLYILISQLLFCLEGIILGERITAQIETRRGLRERRLGETVCRNVREWLKKTWRLFFLFADLSLTNRCFFSENSLLFLMGMSLKYTTFPPSFHWISFEVCRFRDTPTML